MFRVRKLPHMCQYPARYDNMKQHIVAHKALDVSPQDPKELYLGQNGQLAHVAASEMVGIVRK